MHNLSLLLYQTQQIKELEQLAVEKQNLSISVLMQRAGKAAWHVLREKWPKAKKIIVVCGKGNNAGDGYVLAKLAQEARVKAKVLNLVAIDQLQGAAKEAALACKQAKIPILNFSAESLQDVDVIVDALLGTGLKGAVQDEFAHVIKAINAANKPVLALDLPSGLEANTGRVANVAIKADVTVTFIGLKCGLYTGNAPDFCGEIICDDLDIEPSLFTIVHPMAKILDLEKSLCKLPKRSRTAHKGDFGHVLVVGGNFGMGGAARMAAEAAARVGAGLICVATKKEHICAINAARPELMCHGIDNNTQLEPLLASANVVILGPGLGQDEWAKSLLDKVINYAKPLPLVVDADALNLIAKYYNDGSLKKDSWVLTPHPGEAARLLKQDTDFIQNDRFTALSMLQKKFGGVCVLKGAGTLVTAANDDGLVGVCDVGNPGMASGGMGDVLSGIIGGLIAQKMEQPYAAQLGVYLHSYAADLAAQENGEIGLLAMDLLPYIRKMLNF